jgi:hypothetical protein
VKGFCAIKFNPFEGGNGIVEFVFLGNAIGKLTMGANIIFGKSRYPEKC